jgi:hypothetical protein
VPIGQVAKRQFGALRGKLALDPGFHDPLPDDEMEAWGEA